MKEPTLEKKEVVGEIQQETAGRDITQHVIASDGSSVRQIRQSVTGVVDIAGRLDVKFPKRESVYFSVTEAEINMYATLGWVSTILLTLCGIFAGLALGCLVALLQANLPAIAQAMLNSLAWITGVVSVIFFLISIAFILLQQKSKKSWEPIK